MVDYPLSFDFFSTATTAAVAKKMPKFNSPTKKGSATFWLSFFIQTKIKMKNNQNKRKYKI